VVARFSRSEWRSCGDADGSISLMLVLLLGLSFTAGIGFWGLLRLERTAQTLQLQLLECVASRVKKLQSLQNAIEDLNEKIQKARAAVLIASTIRPEALPILRQTVSGLALVQDLQLQTYLLQSKTWRWSKACRALPLSTVHLSELDPDWRRPPADEWGERPLELQSPVEHPFFFSLYSARLGIERRAHAQVFRAGTQENPLQLWSAAWLPRGWQPNSRTIFD